MNKLKQSLIDKYNLPEAVAVVSLYPKKGEIYSRGASGVASYAKNVVRHLQKPVVVLANVWEGERMYEEGSSLVWRVFVRDHLRMWWQLWRGLREFSQIRTVLIHFDFSMYGGMFTSGLFMAFLVGLKLWGYGVVVVSHHVVRDVRKLSGQVGLESGLGGWIKALWYNLAFGVFYSVLGALGTKVVVLEEALRRKMKGAVPDHKMVTIPHAVDEELVMPRKQEARRRLGYDRDEAVVVFFGYVNWFKGADLFAQAFSRVKTLVGKNVRVVIAGGESPTLRDKGYYRDFYQGVVRLVRGSEKIEITGYVPQEKIADYFAAADVVVLPYREFMCASGVLSLVFSYGKPFIVSEELGSMFTAEDFVEALGKANLRKADMMFQLNDQSMVEVTERVLEDGLREKMRTVAGIMRKQRSFAKTAFMYEQALNLGALPKLAGVKGVWAYAE